MQPVMKQLLLIGGGHSHVEVIRRFAQRPQRDVEITLVNPTTQAPYSGMLPGLIAGHYRFEQCHIDLPALARTAGVRFVKSAVNGIHTDAKLAFCSNGETLGYDVAAVDIGSTPGTLGVAGASRYVLQVKPTDSFLTEWDALLLRARQNEMPAGFNVVMVGGGAAGVETLLSIQHRLVRNGYHSARYAVVTDGDDVLEGHPARTRGVFRRILRERNILIHAGQRVVAVTVDAVVTSENQRIPAHLVVWATGASPAGWPGACGLAVDERGFIRVESTLQSVNCPDIFASGDVATLENKPRPKSGVYAVRQGPPLAENLHRMLRGESLLAYHPQSQALALISTGNRYAVASKGWLSMEGAWVWRWKDWIDRRFMKRYGVT